MNIETLNVDQNWQEESTTVWFSVDDENYGVCVNTHDSSAHAVQWEDGFTVKMLDCDGSPISSTDAKNVPIWNAIIDLAKAEFLAQ